MMTQRTDSNLEFLAEAPHIQVALDDVKILLLGTAHISPQSVRDVEMAVEQFHPDTVCVELCQSRYDTMKDPDRWRKLDLSKVIREKKLGLLFSSLILSSFQKKIGENTGVKPGEEMMKACELAERDGRRLVLADREVRTTLSRAWGRVGLWSRMWLMSNLAASLLVREELDPGEIERMKREDVLSDLFATLPKKYDDVKRIIVDERDEYIAEKVRQGVRETKENNGERLLVVVGAGHLHGLASILESGRSVDLEGLQELPAKRPVRLILFWGVAVGMTLLVSWYAGMEGWGALRTSLLAWVLGRSIGAGVGAILAQAHPLTILVTVLMAPVSLFIPGSRLWMFSSLTELWLRKPRVEDFESIADDTGSAGGLLRSFYRNRVLKLFWIITLVSTGLTVGNLHFLGTVLDGIFHHLFSA